MIPPLLFAGGGRFAARCLGRLFSFAPPHAVIVPAPRPAGRGLTLRPSPCEEAARALGIELLRVERLEGEDLRDLFAASGAALVVDFGRRIPAALLELPRFGCLNLHPSLLPEYRGSAPVQRALWEGRERTGVTLFRLVERMDAGPILRARSVGVGPRETAGELLDRLADQGCELLAEALAEGPERWAFRPQDEAAATAAPKIRAEEARLDPGLPARVLSDRIRALAPEPGAYVLFRGARLKILRALPVPAPEGVPRPGAGAFAGLSGEGPLFFCGEGALRLEGVQPEGKKVQVGVEWASGRRLSPADRLE